MIGPGAGGCGMAALFKVLDPLGKALYMNQSASGPALLQPPRQSWGDYQQSDIVWPLLPLKIERTLI